jgi:hypothetical protein
MTELHDRIFMRTFKGKKEKAIDSEYHQFWVDAKSYIGYE